MQPSTLTWERREPGSDVLIVANTWPNEENPAYGIFVKRQVESLLVAGVRCDVLYLRGYRTPLAYLWGALWFLVSSRRLRRHYRLIHAHAGETALVARCALGIPIVVSYQGDDLLGDPGPDGRLTLQSRVRAFVIRQHARLFDATITKSSEMAMALPPGPRSRNRVVPNGVDTTMFSPVPRADARAALGWNQGDFVALFGATKPRIPRKRLWLAEAACHDAAQRLGRPVRLEIAENVAPERMPLLMNAADCLLMTSSIEGSPNTVKEALMCDLPVVATPAGDIEALLEGVEPSWLCEPDQAALGAALADCLASGPRSNGREAADWLSAAAIAARIADVYRKI